jgi:acyl-CoA thioesterase I
MGKTEGKQRRTITRSRRRAVVAAAVGLVLTLLLVGGVLANTGARSVAEDQTRSGSGRPVAVVIGDSQAHGAGDAQLPETWVTQGLAGAGFEPLVLGEAGTGFLQDVDGAPSYLEGLRQGTYTLPVQDVSLVVVEGGGNDDAYPDARIAHAARASLELLKDHYRGADVLVVGPLGRGDDPRRIQINQLLARVAQQEDVYFLNAGDWGRQYQVENLYSADGIHLTEAGHERLTQPFITELQALELGPTD